MAIIGNILLIISFLIFIGLNTGPLAKAPPGGDAGVGYAWSILMLNGAFFIVMILAAGIIGAKGGFEWVTEKKSSRFWIVSLCLLAILITTALSTLFRHEHGDVPRILRMFSAFVPWLFPLILIAAGFILLNSSLRTSVPLALYKWPLVIISALSILGCASALIAQIAVSQRNQAAAIREYREQGDSNHQRMLADIDSCDVMKDMVFILVFTGDNQDADIQEKSVAKVRTNPQWEQELIRLLQTDWAPEPFQFLASNAVDHPDLFLEPVKEGVLIQARLIRQSIRNASHPSHFYEGQFTWEVERVLRTVDRFKGKGVDYAPAVRELRAAFDEPSEYEKPKWRAVSEVEKWLKKNQ